MPSYSVKVDALSSVSFKAKQLRFNWKPNSLFFKTLLMMLSICIIFRSSYFERWGYPVAAWEITDIFGGQELKKVSND